MRLCCKCKNYIVDGGIIKCRQGYWALTDAQKTKTYNPIMFECLDYEPETPSRGFQDDTIFDTHMMMIR